MKRIPTILCLLTMLLLLRSHGLHSQEISRDTTFVTLQQNVEKATTDSLKIDAYIKLGRYQLRQDFNKVESYLMKVFELFEKNPHLVPSGDYAKAYQQLGVINRKRGYHTEALKNYFKTKQIYESINDTLAIGSTYHNIAMVYRYQQEYDKALGYFREAEQIKKKNPENLKSLVSTYRMIGACFYDMKKLDSAAYYAQKVSKLRERLGFKSSNQTQIALLTNIRLERKEFDKVIATAKKEIPEAKVSKRYESLTSWYIRMAQANLGLENKARAQKYADSALQVSTKHQLRNLTATVYKLQTNIYNAKEEYSKALVAYHNYTLVSDTIYNIQKVKELRGIELSNEFNTKRTADSLQYAKEKALLASDIEKRKATRWRNYVIIAFLILVLVALYLFNKKRIQLEQAEKLLLDQELKASEKKIEQKKEEISNLIVESIQQIKSKKELTANLKRVSTKSSENNDLKHIIAQLNAETLEDDKLLIIREKFNEQNFEFHQQLLKNFPTLSSTDLEICSFIKMGLGRNEISKLRNTSVEAVRKSRYRLRKKLAIDDTVDLKAYLSALFQN